MKVNHTMSWPIEGVCDLGCPFYRDGSLENKNLGFGEHCRFKKSGKKEAACGANAMNPVTKADIDEMILNR